jgi:riboflavin biosynthesis pyrimidine reductase
VTTFDAFIVHKTAEAERAAIAGFTTEFDRAERDLLPVGNQWSRRLLDGSFYLSPPPDRLRPAAGLVFVQSRDGNTGARNPSDLAGGDSDKHLIYEGLCRVAADAVLAGAETIRGADIVFSVWHPELVRLRESLGKPRHPTQIVATLRGVDVELFNVPAIRVVVVTVGECADRMRRDLAPRPWITPIIMRRPEDLRWAFERLRELGIERLSAVGGRRIATELVDAGLVQDVYLTTSPKEGGEPATPMYPRALPGDVIVRKRGREHESGVIFEHIRLKPDTGRRGAASRGSRPTGPS